MPHTADNSRTAKLDVGTRHARTRSSRAWSAARRFLFVIIHVGILMAPSRAKGGCIPLLPEVVEKDGHPIVLAEIVAFSPLTLKEVPPRMYPRKGYALTLHMEKTLRGDIEGERFQIPFSEKGCAAVWEFEPEPKVGMKCLVYLKYKQDGKWSDYGRPGSIVPLETYDDPEVRTLRAQLNFWAITDPIARKEAAKTGCFGDDMGFRRYCIDTLAKELPHRDEAAGEYGTLIWEIFSDERTELEHVSQCDGIFWKRYRSLGWNSHEPRRNLKAASRRLLLLDATWEFLNESDAKK